MLSSLALPIRLRRSENENDKNWQFVKRRRQFLFDFAKRMGFDPMVAANWRHQTQNIQDNGVHI